MAHWWSPSCWGRSLSAGAGKPGSAGTASTAVGYATGPTACSATRKDDTIDARGGTTAATAGPATRRSARGADRLDGGDGDDRVALTDTDPRGGYGRDSCRRRGDDVIHANHAKTVDGGPATTSSTRPARHGRLRAGRRHRVREPPLRRWPSTNCERVSRQHAGHRAAPRGLTATSRDRGRTTSWAPTATTAACPAASSSTSARRRSLDGGRAPTSSAVGTTAHGATADDPGDAARCRRRRRSATAATSDRLLGAPARRRRPPGVRGEVATADPARRRGARPGDRAIGCERVGDLTATGACEALGERLAGVLEGLERRRLDDALQVEDALVEQGRARPRRTTAWHGTPAWRARDAISPTALPSSVVASSRPSPVTTAPAARMRSSNPSASSTNGAPGSSRAPNAAHSPPARPPAAPVIGTPRGSRGSVARQRRRAARDSRCDRVAASAPFCGANTAAARSNGVRTSHSTTSRAPRRPPCLLDRLDRARAAVGRRAAARGDEHDLRAGLDRRGDQLAGARARRRLGVALVRAPRAPGRSPRRPRRSPSRRPRPARSPARTGRPSGSCASVPLRLAAERGEQHLERPLAAVGDRAQVGRLEARRARSRARPPPRPRSRGTCP